MHPKIPESIRPLLEAYLLSVNAALPDFLTAFYIHGSIALNAFNERFSDIDFIAVVSRLCTDHDVEHLRAIHLDLAKQFPRWELSGGYMQPNDLGKFEDAIEPHPSFHDGKLHPSGFHDVNSVTWWVLKTHGIALLGPEPQALDFTVDWDLLIRNMRQNLNTYWGRYVKEPRRIAWLLADYGIQWTVLGVLRQFYSFREGDITSKIGAGEYALAHLPTKWHPIVQEAINIREQANESFYTSRIVRGMDGFAFLKYIIKMCNAM
jgi:hypothetical protein